MDSWAKEEEEEAATTETEETEETEETAEMTADAAMIDEMIVKVTEEEVGDAVAGEEVKSKVQRRCCCSKE